MPCFITGTGLYAPAETVSNEELVVAFNEYVHRFNEQHAEAIASGDLPALQESSAEFIAKASGIKKRHVVDKSGILNSDILCPRLVERPNDELSLQAEMGVLAAKEALAKAGRSACEVDMVVVASATQQRAYPAMAVEIQAGLGAKGFAFDMNVACASVPFGIQMAASQIAMGLARTALIISPEICTGHLNFRDRDSHFIFGDACTAVLLEAAPAKTHTHSFEVLGTRLLTQFSNNIRNNYGFLNRATPEAREAPDKLFMQQGRKVFKEVIPLVVQTIDEHLKELNISAKTLKRLWLHQANINMNRLIAEKILGRELEALDAPIILDEYANTSSAGSIIAFHQYHEDLQSGDLGLICAFGAGYSVGSVVVRKV